MTIENSIFQQTMQPWPTLKNSGKQIKLPDHHLEVFYFEGGNPGEQNLLMVHGLGDEADTWRHVFIPLSEKFHAFALDLPGFGRSDKPNVDYTPEFMIGALIEFMDQLGISSTIIMGSSLGGILAHGLALNNPERVEGLILVGGALYNPEQMQDWIVRLMRLPLIGEWLYTRLRKDPHAAFASLKNVYYQLDGLPEADRSFLFTRVNQRVWSDGQRRAYFSTLRKFVPWLKQHQMDLTAQLKHLEIPTLVIRGQHDPLFPESNAQAIVDLQPNTIKVIIKETGHLPQQEDPETFLQNVKLWLNQHF